VTVTETQTAEWRPIKAAMDKKIGGGSGCGEEEKDI
jgi:hypothetical protein